MCLRTRPGTPSGLVALRLGVRRSASCIMVGVVHPVTIGMDEDDVGRTWANHGKGAPGGSVGFGDKAAVLFRRVSQSPQLGR